MCFYNYDIVMCTVNEKKGHRAGGWVVSRRKVRSAEYEDIDVTFPTLTTAGR
jgi:hypothetical protein